MASGHEEDGARGRASSPAATEGAHESQRGTSPSGSTSRAREGVATEAHAQVAADATPIPLWLRLAPLWLFAASLLPLRAVHAPFTFDDVAAIVQNPHIESLTPLSSALDAPEGSGADGRPLVALSLALDYAIGGRAVEGYRVFNTLVHALATLALFALARTIARRLGAAPRSERALAFALALVWCVHPLHTAALDHVVYRGEAMMALAYLTTLWAAMRGFDSRPESGARRAWYALSIAACLAGTGCKEVIVSAPLVVWLFDRTLASGGFAAALRAHRALYVSLFASWPLLGWIVLGGDRGESVGFGGHGVGPLESLATQAGVLVHYLKLAIWPAQLALDYDDWPLASGLGDAWPALGALTLSFVLCVAACAARAMRARTAGALGLAVFAILAPTSSVIPLVGAIVGEHRMYLPLAALLGLVALAIARALPRAEPARLALLLALVTATPLAIASWRRHGEFRSELELWRTNVERRPTNARAWNTYGTVLRAAGDDASALAAYRRALELKPAEYRAWVNVGNLELAAGRTAAAIEAYGRACALRDDIAEIRYSLGAALVANGDGTAGVEHLRAALSDRMRPPGLVPELRVPARQTLAWTLATSADPSVRAPREALALAQALNAETGGRRPRLLATLAAALAANERYRDALATIDRCLELAEAAGRPAASWREQRVEYARAAGAR